MPPNRSLYRAKGKHPRFGWHACLVAVFTMSAGILICAGTASAAEAVAIQPPLKRFPIAQIFTFLFLMLGPIKVIGPFAKITRGADAALTNQIALRAILFSSLALLLATFFGEKFLDNFNIPLPVLVLSAGIILFLVALLNILQQFMPPAAHSEEPAGQVHTPALSMALTPLAFPTIVTPYGIAALVVFLALSPDLKSRMTVGAILLAIMLLNLIVMLMTRHILPVLNVLLPILGAILGVVQVALGLQIIISSLRMMGAF
jgi:multiple antibiotic resistance protein